MPKRNGFLSLVPLALVFLTAAVQGQQPSTKNGEWPYYTADLKGTK